MLYKAFKLVFLFIFATVCHWGLATLFSFYGMSVNMMLVFAIAFCTVLPLEAGYPLVFLCGLFLDFFGTKLFGNNAFSFTVIACIIYALRERIDFERYLPQMVTVFLCTLIVGIINSILLIWFTSSSQWPGVLSLLGGAIIDGLFAPFVFGLARFALREESPMVVRR
ncbi:MAG: rod shape-determining protein MreD [Elusimicrobiaceae bacterium]|nr:rod shape-determining protein MreD [Elusimicrobiaceae bacterium]